MAAIQKVSPSLSSPVGYELVFLAYASEQLAPGDLVVITADTPPSTAFDNVVAKADDDDAAGIVLKHVLPGGLAEVAWRGEMDGYQGLTPNQRLSVVDGQIDDVVPLEDEELPETPRIRAITPTRILFDLT